MYNDEKISTIVLKNTHDLTLPLSEMLRWMHNEYLFIYDGNWRFKLFKKPEPQYNKVYTLDEVAEFILRISKRNRIKPEALENPVEWKNYINKKAKKFGFYSWKNQ